MNDARPAAESPDHRADAGSAGTASRLRTNVAWGLSVIGAVFPGLMPIAVFFGMCAGFMGDAELTPIRLVEQRFVLFGGCVGGPLLGASLGALVGLRHGSRFERALRRFILCGSAGMLLSIASFLDSENGFAFGLLPAALFAGLWIAAGRRTFSLRMLLLATGLGAAFLAWASYPLRPDPLLTKAELALRAIAERTAEDPALRPKSQAPSTTYIAGHPNPDPGHVYLRSALAIQRGDGSRRKGEVHVLFTRHSWRIRDKFTSGRLDARFDKHTEWTAEGEALFIQVRSITGDPDAHDRLLTIVQEELLCQGINLDEKHLAP
jgi:hypothetical protein